MSYTYLLIPSSLIKRWIAGNLYFQARYFTMKFNNIERNILYLLSDKWLDSGALGPFETKWIFDKYSDIPDENIKIALKSLKDKGLVEFPSNNHHIYLALKGLSQIKVLKLPENGEFPIPKKLE